MTRYFIICASKDHVMRGVKHGFAQAGHGRKDLISKPAKGDWLVFYSSKDKMEQGRVLQEFTASGRWPMMRFTRQMPEMASQHFAGR